MNVLKTLNSLNLSVNLVDQCDDGDPSYEQDEDEAIYANT